MKKKWNLKPKAKEQLVTELQENLGVAKIIAELLAQRGITTFESAKTFFRPDISHLHDPFLMKDMDSAVARLSKAIRQSENILVYGDYDVDGTTAVSLMYSFIKSIHEKVEYYIPDRYTEGYGVSLQGVDYAANNKFSLIITLDCGIKAIDKVDYANEQKTQVFLQRKKKILMSLQMLALMIFNTC